MTFQEELIGSLRIHGEKTAIEQGEQQYSYAEILELANAITRFLLEMRVEPQSPVGILMDDKFGLICTMIGIANARCIFVPIDHTLPEERIGVMLTDLNLECVISSDGLRLPGLSKQFSL